MKTTNYIPSLNGLRAISIALVLIGHAGATMPYEGPAYTLIMRTFGNAGAGVLTFFVISGYLITTLLRNEMEKTGAISFREFYLRRVLRIFPAFYAYLIVVFLLTATGVISTSIQDLLAAATFSLNYKHLWIADASNEYAWFVGHFWTLALEEQFYILWPLTIFIASLHGAKRIAICIILVWPIMRVGTYFLFPQMRGQIGMMLHTGADPIMVGSLIALGERNLHFERLIRPATSGAAALVAATFVLIVSPMLDARFGGSYALPVGITLNSLAIGVFLLYAIRNSKSWFGKFLNNRLIVYIGLISYSLYLWQQLFLTTLNTTWIGRYPMNMIACFLAAICSYRFLEMPFLKLKDSLARRRLRRAESPVLARSLYEHELPRSALTAEPRSRY